MTSIGRSEPVYLDHNATSPLRPEAAEAVVRAMALAGNPSSVHAAGRAARASVEDARNEIARLVGTDPLRLVLTGGGTETNALAVHGAIASGRIGRLILGATEHDAVVYNARRAAEAAGLAVEVWPVDPRGVADLDWLADRLARLPSAEGRPWVALMLANNETGVIQPVAEAAALVHQRGALLHVDAVQATGKIAVDMAALGADTLSLSAHKLGGPKGVGALAFAASAPMSSLIGGGGQERGLRAGTENVAGIAGFAAAAIAALRDLADAGRPDADPQAAWRDRAAGRLGREGAAVVGEGAARLPGTLCVAASDWAASLQVMALDLEGVMVSAGAACSSGKVRPSGVLQAMGLEALAGSAIRASGGWSTREADWDRFADVWLGLHARRLARGRVKEFA